MDHVDRILTQWAAERPDLDASPMAVVGRLARAAGALAAELDRTFARHGIDASTFDVLATLRRQGAPHRLPPAQLARESMITTSAVAQRLNRLEGLGLVARLPRPEDGRGKLVELTAAGRRLVDRVLPDHLATEEALLAPLDARERRTLAELLGRLDPASA
ncbi:MarR family winged helix-turn-helix transcriptional regulator [Clavibacter zhangzhiyongii]|uniref:MarR family winged helix-turn-helix transcriptional regulator n=1 Tax=Clavibacter zhangzhiyongii TaxID=2768071 RepID=UPI0019594A46|nr:MarR family transcriptional regulator [Clavibacter zhangzhiyongii]MBM7026539.1 MarR family transcriptional regulator [Clavibacter zhangzhiyongii]